MEKIYCGSGKSKFDGDLISVNICLSDIPKEEIQTGKNGKKYVRINVSKRKQEDNYGNTHSVSLDTWKPDPSKQEAVKQDLPF
jgi:hypothetical protein|tara:strand:+ start:486 stop:734 length:249 start_codon:yes stop_codon:yes gene_type:complete